MRRGQGIGRFFKGIKKNIVKSANIVGHKAEQTFNKVSDITSGVLFGRDGLGPHIKRILENRGNQIFKIDEIRRAPIPGAIQGFVNFLSGGKVPYDTLFHLSIVGSFPDGQRLIIEKNEVINMSMKIYKADGTEMMPVQDLNPKTLNEIMQNTKNFMGDKFIPYSAHDNNCQDFLLSLLHANGLNTNTINEFVKQDTAVVMKGNPYLRKFANTLTDVAGRADVIKQGGMIGYYNGGILRSTIHEDCL